MQVIMKQELVMDKSHNIVLSDLPIPTGEKFTVIILRENTAQDLPLTRNKIQRTKTSESSREYSNLLSEAPWVSSFLQTASTLNDVKSLLPLYMEINKLIAENKFSVCNSFLKQVQTQELSDTLLVGLLRLTSSYKDKLPYWTTLLTNAKQELRNRKYDSDAVLKGLL